MSQPCFRCHSTGRTFSMEDLQCNIICPVCMGNKSFSTDYIQCQPCRGTGYSRADRTHNGKLIKGTICTCCNKTGIVKTSQTIMREQQEIQAKQQREAALLLQQHQYKANLAIQQRDQQITQLKQRESTLLEQIKESKVRITQLESLGKDQQDNYIKLLLQHVKLQEELINLKQNNP